MTDVTQKELVLLAVSRLEESIRLIDRVMRSPSSGRGKLNLGVKTSIMAALSPLLENIVICDPGEEEVNAVIEAIGFSLRATGADFRKKDIGSLSALSKFKAVVMDEAIKRSITDD